MGWWYQHREKGISDKEWFQRELFPSGTNTIVESASKGNVFYAAVLVHETNKVWGLVCLKQWVRGDEFNFGYKDMDESMGPFCYDCPERILNRLSEPAINDSAAKWRAACRAEIAKRALRPKLKAGDTIQFPEPLTFRDNRQRKYFRVESLRPLRLLSTNDGVVCRVPQRLLATATVVQS